MHKLMRVTVATAAVGMVALVIHRSGTGGKWLCGRCRNS